MLYNVLRISLALGIFAVPVAQAAPTGWVGYADYTAAPSNEGDEDLVGPFDLYDFARGAAVIENAIDAAIGNVLSGVYQSFVTNHQRLGDVVSAPGLNSTYELTIAAEFTELVTFVSGGLTAFDVTGGSATLYFDTDLAANGHDFGADTGFNEDDPILAGTIVGGFGNVQTAGSQTGGVTVLNIRIDDFDANVFDPDTIISGESFFTLEIRQNDALLAEIMGGNNSVQGVVAEGNNLLIGADGTLNFLAVPEPLSLLLVGSAVGGLVMIRRRSRG